MRHGCMTVSTETLMSVQTIVQTKRWWFGTTQNPERNTRINYETERGNKREKERNRNRESKTRRRWSTPVSTATGIGQIFHNKHIFNNNNNITFKVEIWKMVWTNVFFFQFPGILCPLNGSETQRGNFRVHVRGLPSELAPSAPPLGNRSWYLSYRMG